MKVIVICASPRKNGNSEILADQFIKGAQFSGHDVEKINIAFQSIKHFLACEYCRYHENECIQKDDSQTIIQKIIEADVLTFVTPIYFYSLPAQLKLLIDRFFAKEYEIRESQKRKKAYFILTSGTTDIQQTVGCVESLRGFIKILRTVDECGIIYGLGAFHKGDAFKHKSFQEAFDMGKDIE